MWIYRLGYYYDAKDVGILNEEKQMPIRTLLSLWGIAITWAIVWTMLHFTRPASFPWIGTVAGFLVVAPLLVLNWLEQRKERQRAQREREERKGKEPRL